MKILNLIVLVFSSVILSYFLPTFINLALPEKRIIERVKYSAVIDDFLISKSNKDEKTTKYAIQNKHEITQDEFYEYLPFSYYQILIPNKKFPQKFKEYEQDPSLIRKNSQGLNLKYSSNKAKHIPLYLLLDTDKYGNLSYTQELFRVKKDGFEVINLQTNSIDQNSSKALNQKLEQQGFKFPAKGYFTNPSTLKPFDEGAFIIDSKDEIFHIRQNMKNISVKNTNIIKKDIINIMISEDPRREFYAILIAKNEIGLIGYDYNFINLNNSGYDPFGMNLNLSISPVDKILTFLSNDITKINVMDLNYTTIKENFTEFSKPVSNRHLKEYFLPFELKLSQHGHFYKFSFNQFSKKAMILSFIIALIYFMYNLKFKNRKRYIESGIIAIFGIYGFISTLFFKENL